MSKITFDMNTNSATAVLFALRAAEIAEFWNGAPVTGTINDAYDVLNPILSAQSSPPLLCGEEFGTAVPKLNSLNSIYATLGAAVGANNAFVIEPDSVFTDTAGTVPAEVGQPVAAIRTVGGDLLATQSSEPARPTYGRYPEAGLRNRLPNNTPSGAVLGVLGAGGALPTGWDILFSAGAAGTAEIVGIGGEYVDLRIVQTGTSGAPIVRPVTAGASLPTCQGDDWALSVGLAIIAGDLAGNGQVELSGTERTDAGAVLESFSFLQPVPITSTLTRFSGTAAIENANTARLTPAVRFASTGPWDATFRIQLPQLERGTAATDVQTTRTDGFDVTEAGQRSVYYLQPDGVDDWMQLTTPFAPMSGYTFASAWQPRTGTSGEVFGRITSGGTSVRFTESAVEVRSNTISNRRVWTSPTSTSRHVFAAIVSSLTVETAFRDGLPLSVAQLDGQVFPLAFEIGAMFRAGSSYGAGRFYGGAMIPSAITETQRQIVERSLAYASGVLL